MRPGEVKAALSRRLDLVFVHSGLHYKSWRSSAMRMPQEQVSARLSPERAIGNRASACEWVSS